MRIFCLCVVKDEADVLEESVSAAARWADGIYIADNRSSDDTPAVIERLVERYSNVFNAGPIDEAFTDDMRGKIFNRVRSVSKRGDWWCKLDADEFFIDDPREFLAALPKETDTVWGSFHTFYFTEEDLRRYETDPAAFMATPITQRLRYYKNNESEIRFVKHAFPLIWRKEWPKFRCAAYPKRIRVAHFRYRSPEQIIRRVALRRQVARRTRGVLFPHELGNMPVGFGSKSATATPPGQDPDFRERVVPVEGLDSVVGGEYRGRDDEPRPITDIWRTAVPFWIWKPIWILRALLNVKRYVPRRVRRLVNARR